MPFEFSFPEVPPLDDTDTLPIPFLEAFNQLSTNPAIKAVTEDLWTGPVQAPEQICEKYPHLFNNIDFLKALIQTYSKARIHSIQSAKKRVKTERDQIQFLLDTEKQLIFISLIYQSAGDLFYSPELEEERSMVLNALHQDIESVLKNISFAFKAGIYGDYRDVLIKCFDDVLTLGLCMLAETPKKIKKFGSHLNHTCFIDFLYRSIDWD
jgi:hypothetical protein